MLYSGETTKDEVPRHGGDLGKGSTSTRPPQAGRARVLHPDGLQGPLAGRRPGPGLRSRPGRQGRGELRLRPERHQGDERGGRHASQIDEKRPYGTAQGTLVGHLAAVSSGAWTAATGVRPPSSTGSSASLPAPAPMRSWPGQAPRPRRARAGPAQSPALEARTVRAGAGLATSYRRITTTPPVPGDSPRSTTSSTPSSRGWAPTRSPCRQRALQPVRGTHLEAGGGVRCGCRGIAAPGASSTTGCGALRSRPSADPGRSGRGGISGPGSSTTAPRC